jgi:hypothetical protein
VRGSVSRVPRLSKWFLRAVDCVAGRGVAPAGTMSSNLLLPEQAASSAPKIDITTMRIMAAILGIRCAPNEGKLGKPILGRQRLTSLDRPKTSAAARVGSQVLNAPKAEKRRDQETEGSCGISHTDGSWPCILCPTAQSSKRDSAPLRLQRRDRARRWFEDRRLLILKTGKVSIVKEDIEIAKVGAWRRVQRAFRIAGSAARSGRVRLRSLKVSRRRRGGFTRRSSDRAPLGGPGAAARQCQSGPRRIEGPAFRPANRAARSGKRSRRSKRC